MLFPTFALLAMRTCVITSITIALAPWEVMFDAIESELNARGVVA